MQLPLILVGSSCSVLQPGVLQSGQNVCANIARLTWRMHACYDPKGRQEVSKQGQRPNLVAYKQRGAPRQIHVLKAGAAFTV